MFDVPFFLVYQNVGSVDRNDCMRKDWLANGFFQRRRAPVKKLLKNSRLEGSSKKILVLW